MKNENDQIVSRFKVVKELKNMSAYLVKLGLCYSVVKGEYTTVGLKRGPGAEVRTRVLSICNRWGGATPQVKKSVKVISEIFNHVTGDLGGIFTLTTEQTSVWAVKIAKGGYSKDDAGRAGRRDHLYANAKCLTWYVMPVYENIIDFFELKKLGPTSMKMKDVKNQLIQQPSIFSQLGRIVAVDCFICNADRFWYHPERPPAGEWCNLGNLFLTWAVGKPIRFIGLDFFDTQIGASCYFGLKWQDVASKLAESGGNGTYALRHFKSLKKGRSKIRRLMAKALIDALGQEINMVPNRLMYEALYEGIEICRTRLVEFYKHRLNYESWPRGLESRFKACGW